MTKGDHGRPFFSLEVLEWGYHQKPVGSEYMAESDLGSDVQEDLTREMRAQLAAVTGGLAPDDYAQAWWDWFLNMSQSPGEQTEIAQNAFQAIADNFSFAAQAATGKPVAPASDDKRFAAEAW